MQNQKKAKDIIMQSAFQTKDKINAWFEKIFKKK